MIAPINRVSPSLSEKINALVAERGWNQEDFARHAGLNRQTVRLVMQPGGLRRMRNTTVAACARALGFTVSELTNASIDYLLCSMRPPSPDGTSTRVLYERATQPELLAWLERNPERAAFLSPTEIDELLSLQGTGGPLTSFGVDHFVSRLERRRAVISMVHDLAGTEYMDLMEQFLKILHEKIRPYAARA